MIHNQLTTPPSSSQSLPPSLSHLYPFTSHFLPLPHPHLPSSSLNYHYLDEGSGSPILMFHGNPTWSFYYRNLISSLRSSYRCIAPDHIGCGLSDKPQNYPYTLSQHILNASSLIQSLNLPFFDLIVHDWGGPIGLAIAQKFSHKLRKIIILNTSLFPLLSPLPWQLKLSRLGPLSQFLIRRLNLFLLGTLSTCSSSPLSPQIKSAYLYPYQSYHNRKALFEFVQDIPLHPSHPSWNTLQEIQSNIHIFKNHPIHIFWGGRDFVFTETFFNHWKSLLPHALTTFYPTANHLLLEDAHSLILPPLKNFLSSSFN